MRLFGKLKGQTALEYLMTYGWAILIVIIVVGALFALGLTKPCRWAGTQVREFSGFQVSNPKATSTALSFDLSSLSAQTVNITAISTSHDLVGNTVSPALGTGYSLGTTPVRFTITSATTVASNDCYEADVSVTYNVVTAGGSVAYNSTGKITGVLSTG